jgi:hypothetical protein
MRNAERILMGKVEQNSPLRRALSMSVDRSKMDLRQNEVIGTGLTCASIRSSGGLLKTQK